MEKQESQLKTKYPLIWDLILTIVCFILIILGVYESSTGKVEDGLINIVIGTALLSIPISGATLNYKSALNWQKIILIVSTVVVIGAISYLIYLGFRK